MKYKRRTARYTCDRSEDKYRDCKGTKYNPSFGQNTELREKLDTSCKQKARNRLPRILKNCTPKGRRTPVTTLKRLLDK
jgi:hypothetical protein